MERLIWKTSIYSTDKKKNREKMVEKKRKGEKE